MENLYGYYFHYNPFTKIWSAIEIAKLQDYNAGKLDKNEILKNKNIQVLIDFLSNPNAKVENA